MRAWRHSVLWIALVLSITSITDAGLGQEAPVPRSSAGDGVHPNPAQLNPHQRAVYLSARRGMDWLWRANRSDGLFVFGFNPALNTPLEGETFVSQAEAAFALARSARYSGEERYTARARQAVLALLAGTKTDAESGGRCPGEPAQRLGGAAFLVLGVAELPQPGADLLEPCGQLCQYLRKQQQPDGSFLSPVGNLDADAGNRFSGLALSALLRSHQLEPAAWKLESARKALPFYRARWADAPGLAFAAGHCDACCEAFLQTKEKAFADFAFEMCDWLCGQQYGLEARNPLWQGGFAVRGKASAMSPDVHSALAAAALTDGCRVARQLGDVQRFNRYRDALQRSWQFLMTLQYSPANVQHFTEAFQPRVVGAFFPAHADGTVRVDHTACVVQAMAEYLEHVAPASTRPNP